MHTHVISIHGKTSIFQLTSVSHTAVNRDDGRRTTVAFSASMSRHSLRFPEHTFGCRPRFSELTRTQRRRQQRQRSAANYDARATAAVPNCTSPDRSILVVHLPLRLQRYRLSEPITLGFQISASSEPWLTFRREVAGSRRTPSPWRPAQRDRISRQLDGMPRTVTDARGCPYFCSSSRHDCHFHRLASRTAEQLRNDTTIPVDIVNMVQHGGYSNLNQPRYINGSLDRRPADHSVDRRFRALRLMSSWPVNHHVTPPCYDGALGFMTSSHRPRIPSRRSQPRRHDFNINTSASARRRRSSSERHSMSPGAAQLRSAGAMVDFHTRYSDSDGHDRQHPFRRSGIRPTVINDSVFDTAMSMAMEPDTALRSPYDSRYLSIIDQGTEDNWH